ncbi:hypothetical protein Tsubulata_010961 [Turnera subulata]|uniref:Eukaryotic translation initiation factor 4B3-like n=1 Tax=Turnera subulata TaxID=218843 RepID=A0A9Q0J2N2_9ROSI|nr:hypothetical protein Tsubulata_010961 [Turnera subulata]
MAAAVSSPWGKPGAWALDAEENEAELQQEHEQQQKQQSSVFSAPSEFPSLAAAASTKQPKKKKNQTLSLAEFSKQSTALEPRGLTPEDLLVLPTGPRQRSAEELDRTRLGGGFRNYGQNSRGDDSSNSRWGGGGGSRDGGSNGSRFSNRESNREYAPSRADEIDDWSKTKKSPTGNGFESSRRERGPGGSFFDSQSRADESDSWVANKPSDPPRRHGSFEKRGSFDSLSRDRQPSNGGGFSAADSDSSWGRKNSFDSLSRDRQSPSGGFSAADSDSTWGRKREESSGNGSNGRPRLVLQPRTLPVSNGNGAVAKPKGPSPFGEARPREEVLAEKGQDYKEIDEKLESVKISEKKEVERGRRSFGGNGRSSPGDERTETSWRKPVDVDADASGTPVTDDAPLSAETTENVYAALEEINEEELAEGN